MADGVLPPLLVLPVVGELGHDELVDVVQGETLRLALVDGHVDEADVGVGGLAVGLLLWLLLLLLLLWLLLLQMVLLVRGRRLVLLLARNRCRGRLALLRVISIHFASSL